MKQRIQTGVILLLLAFSGFFLLEGSGFACFIGAVCVLAAFEWAQLSGLRKKACCLYAALFALSLAALYWPQYRWEHKSGQFGNFAMYSAFAAPLLWSALLLLLLFYPRSRSILTEQAPRLLLGLSVFMLGAIALSGAVGRMLQAAHEHRLGIDAPITLIWFFFCLAVSLLPLFYSSARTQMARQALHLLLGLLILTPAWVILAYLHPIGSHSEGIGSGLRGILWLLALIWLADSGAYFVGKRFGKHKLLPAVSPGKSREGLAGGLLAALLPVLGYGLYLGMGFYPLLKSLLIAALVVLAALLGDLTESLFKREAGVKDSSNLLPGHGGVLDRIDSLTCATPIYFLLAVFLSPNLFLPGL